MTTRRSPLLVPNDEIKIVGRLAVIAAAARYPVSCNFLIMFDEVAFDLRDAFAAENYIRQAKNAKGNQQLKDAQQQAAPKF